MNRFSAKSLPLVVALLVCVPLSAQEEPSPETRITLDGLRNAREQVAADTALTEDLRTRIQEVYGEAINLLEAAAGYEREAAKAEREKSGVARRVEALHVELSKPETVPRLKLPANPTAGQAESALARERSRLAAHRAGLQEVERLSEERASLRTDLSRQLGSLDQKLEVLADELREATQGDLHPDLKQAVRSRVLADRESSLKKIDSLRAQLALLEARGALIPWQIDQAQRRVVFSEQLVAMLQEATEGLRHDELRQLLEQVREQCRRSAEQAEELTSLAVDTEQLAEWLWGPEGVVIRSEQTDRELARTRKNLTELNRIAELTRRQFRAAGHRRAATRWWPQVSDDFPEPGDVVATVKELAKQIPLVQHQLIVFEQQRSAIRERTRPWMTRLEAEIDAERLESVQQSARDLLGTQREVLDELVREHGRYSNLLVELDGISQGFVEDAARIQGFLYEQLLWVRSVPRPIIPRPSQLGAAVAWLVSADHIGELFRAVLGGLTALPGKGLGFVLLFGVLLAPRRWIRRRMEGLTCEAAQPGGTSHRQTLLGLLFTFLLVLPVPLAMYLAGALILRHDGSTYVYSAGMALTKLAGVLAYLETLRQLLSPCGVATAHFGWPFRKRELLDRNLLWGPEVIGLPLLFVALHLGYAGMALDSPEQLQAHNNSLGRIAFIAGLSILGVSLLGLFRPRQIHETQTRFVYAYPLILLGTLVPAGLAVAGYYITGLLLSYMMLRTLWLVLILVVLSAVLLRWRSVDTPTSPATSEEVRQAQARVRGLSRFAIIAVAAVGLYGIWSDAVPVLGIMKRVQVWPRIALIERQEVEKLVLTSVSKEETAPPDDSESSSSSTPTIPGMPPTTGATESGTTAEAGSVLTLWHLLEAILAGLITFVLVKNLPSLIEMLLQRRAGMDRGVRIAISTLVRYMILILGVSITFGVLGLSWNKIQWLAAALTFGLGFGLQEIVANFVSGLILLVERPVRVGDAVTVGNLQGRVTQIQIRATTITLWDRSEMIVPNKEFVTTKLVNWTLSDSKRRLDIPVRLAYGSDVQKVKETLLEVASQHPNVLDDPPSSALLIEFGDDALKFELRIYVDFGVGLSTRDELQVMIDRAFREKGIEFAIPQLSIHTTTDPTRPGPTKS
jgi:potassium efflux system protein